jgi:hypothetical protein
MSTLEQEPAPLADGTDPATGQHPDHVASVSPDEGAEEEPIITRNKKTGQFSVSGKAAAALTGLAVLAGVGAGSLLYGRGRAEGNLRPPAAAAPFDYDAQESEGQEPAEETFTPEFIHAQELPAEYWEHSGLITHTLEEKIRNNDPSMAESTTPLDRLTESVYGIVRVRVPVDDKTTFIIDHFNPTIVEIPDPTGRHEYLIALAAMEPKSGKMVHTTIGYGEGTGYMYDNEGSQLFSFLGPDGQNVPHTPRIVAAEPKTIDESGVTLLNTTGWQAWGKEEGLTSSDMAMHSYAVIFRADGETEQRVRATYGESHNMRSDYDKIMEDARTVKEQEAIQN